MSLKSMGLTAALLVAACGGSDTAGPSGGPTPQTPVPAELVGSWYHGSVSPTNFYDPGTGHWDNGYGEGLFYTLTADGHFESGFRAYTSSYGCTDAVLWYKSGTVAVDPATNTFTLYPTQAVMHSEDNCHPEWNYDKPIPRDTQTLSWGFGDDGWGTTALLLHDATTVPTAFYPWQ